MTPPCPVALPILHDHLSYFRGVRHSDPLPPLLFCIVEDALNKNLSRLVEMVNLKFMKATKNIMIYCIGSQANLRALMIILTIYALASNMVINPSKAIIFF